METMLQSNAVSANVPIDGKKPSRRERKLQARPNTGEEALKTVEALYASNRPLFDAYRRAVKADSTVTLDGFFAGIIGRIRETESAIANLAKHRDYIPSADYGYGGNNATMIASHLMGNALSSANVKSAAAKRGTLAIRAAKTAK